MDEENKIKILYKDLVNPKVDEIIAEQTTKLLSNKISQSTYSISNPHRYNIKIWLYLMLIAIISILVVLYMLSPFRTNGTPGKNPKKTITNTMKISNPTNITIKKI